MRRLRLVVLPIALCAAPLAAQSADPLAVFDEAWSAMSRAYFDTTLVKGRWRVAYDSLRTSLGATPTMDQMRDALRTLITVPGQSHFALIPPDALPSAKPSARASGGPRGTAGIVARLAADTLIVWRVDPGSAAQVAGVRPGDAITHVDAVDVDSVRQRLVRAFPSSPRESNALFVMVISQLLDGAAGDTVKVTVRDIRGRAVGHILERGPMIGRVSQYGNLPPMVIRVGSSRVDLQACKLEYSIVSPK